MRKESSNIEKKIVYLLERISQVFRVLLWEAAKKKKLTPLQVQILNFLKNRKKNECIPSKIAEEFDLTKATLSEAVKVLIKKGLIRGIKNSKDKRFTFLLLTPEGRKFVRELSQSENIFEKYLNQFNVDEHEKVMKFLVNLVTMLYADGHITVARICCTCRHFRRNESGFYCALMDKYLTYEEININCKEYKPALTGGNALCC